MVTGDDLAVRGAAQVGYPVSHPRPGWAEQDPAAWETALAPAIGAALADAGCAADQVSALGVAGQLDGCVAIGRDRRPRGPCLIWMDRRAGAEMPELPDDFARITGLVADPGHMAAKIRWLAGRDRELVGFHQPVSYLVSRLTGIDVMDHGLASTTMLYALEARDYAAELLERFEIERAALPAIAEAEAMAGRLDADGAALTGLRPGTAVAVGTGDDFATPLGAGVYQPGTVACVLGTAEVVGAVSPTPVVDPNGLVETHAYPGGTYFVENPGWLAGGALEWLDRLLGTGGVAELDRLAAAVPPGADRLTFVPALSGAMAPEWIPSARGCFHGLTASHGRGHLARAVLEGCGFAMRDVIDRLRELGVAGDALLLLGGGARSRLWPQIRADIAAVPVAVHPRADTCPVGAAMLAAVAGGVQPDLAACVGRLNQPRATIHPLAEAVAAYRQAYTDYRALFASLRPLWAS